MWRPFKGPWTSLRTQAAEKLHALHRTEILDDAGATFMSSAMEMHRTRYTQQVNHVPR